MSTTLEAARSEVLHRAAATAETLSGAPPELQAEELLEGYYHDVLTEDLLAQEPRDLLGAAVAHRASADVRQPGEAVVDAFTPTTAEHGWSTGRTVVEIVTDDMPFLVDSVLNELGRQGMTVRLLVHPQPAVRRDDHGTLTEIVRGRATAAVVGGRTQGDLVRESWIHVQVGAVPDERLPELTDRLRRVLADVRAAVEDFPGMEARARDISALLLQDPPSGVDTDEIQQARQLLDWLVGGHFVFLGYREYRLLRGDGPDEASLGVVPDSGLGILRGDGPASTALPPAVARKAAEPRLVIVTKANSVSTVHRSRHLDYVGVKIFDENGEVTGEQRFLGLFTPSAYSAPVTEVPFVSDKVAQVFERTGFARQSHLGKDLLAVLKAYPRSELFQDDVEHITEVVSAVVHLRVRPRTRLFVRKDDYERFTSCLIYIPRDHYSASVQRRVEALLSEALDGESAQTNEIVTESPLAQVHVVVRVAPGATAPDADADELERLVVAAVRTWEEELAEAARARLGDDGPALVDRFTFPGGYKEDFTLDEAVDDLRHIDALPRADDAPDAPDADDADGAGWPNALGLHLYRPERAVGRAVSPEERRLKLYRHGDLPLSAVLPIFSGLGLEVVDERPHTLGDGDDARAYIYDFGLRAPSVSAWEGDPDDVRSRLEEAFLAVWNRQAEADGFNALVLLAGLTWRQVVILRAVAAYLRQTGSIFSREYVENTMRENPQLARLLVQLFETRFDPHGPLGAHAGEEREAAEQDIVERITSGLEDVASLDQDRIIRALLAVIRATVRTSYYLPPGPIDEPRAEASAVSGTGEQPYRPTVALKFDPSRLPMLPEPRPWAEVWVYGRDVEGVHLRFGPVARGGLRWSDRREDFRTEVLGLVKAQVVKNAIIIPVGAKGGFVPKYLPDPSHRDAWQATGKQAYRLFVSSLLDVTDNIVGGEVVPPAGVVRHDDDDPYLVVAADKGTAAFSDVANAVARDYDYWLDDAFASGGSSGYDHKEMGITARGAWEAVKRHFRELGLDTQSEGFTAAGVGDMSGDVFGNGMLLSEHIRLVAAFDHRHIFLDPDPDPAITFAERRRLFDMPRSTWADYDTSLISAGGGVYPRTAKSVPVSAQVRERLGLVDEIDNLTPAELIRAILRAPVDLFWNGGIGTYVKASTESDEDIGDRANDAVRVDGDELRCRVVGEGGNLGLSQLGRIEAAMNGVRLNTDAIDNSAGVDSSDHEVNIKILLSEATASGELAPEARDELLESLTEDVAARVLRQNYEQSVLLGNARTVQHRMLGAHERLMHWLEDHGGLDRSLEFLPDDAELARRAETGGGLTSPEFAVLVAYAKLSLKDELLSSDLPDQPWFARELHGYFPDVLRDRFTPAMDRHRLRREIIATRVANSVVNRGGTTFVYRAMEETGADPAQVARAFVVAREIFGISEFVEAVESLDNVVGTDTQAMLYLEFRRLLDRAVRWLVQRHPDGIDVAAEIERLQPAVASLVPAVPELLRGDARTGAQERRDAMVEAGVPEDLARHAATLVEHYVVLDVVALAQRTGRPLEQVAAVRAAAEEHFGVDVLLTRLEGLPREARWDALARAALRDDLYAALGELTAAVLEETDDALNPDERLARWSADHKAFTERSRTAVDGVARLDVVDLAPLSVALRALRAGMR
ncbi:NAD-glutamate dehydrogenase [Georgenia halophila]|uniref:NAD-glutamate dehydrogenase n=1 Tax=Georgenia halophila TaxID=620889 RepID=A0ABP8LBX4_9MICO